MKLCPHCGMDIERDARIESGSLIFDPHTGVFVDGEQVRMTTSERMIVGALMKADGAAVSSGALIELLGTNATQPDSVIRVFVSRIRRRLGRRDIIKNIWGYGYRWAA